MPTFSITVTQIVYLEVVLAMASLLLLGQLEIKLNKLKELIQIRLNNKLKRKEAERK